MSQYHMPYDAALRWPLVRYLALKGAMLARLGISTPSLCDEVRMQAAQAMRRRIVERGWTVAGREDREPSEVISGLVTKGIIALNNT